MTKSIERLENLVRVLRGVDPAEFDMTNWCDCAIGHAVCDEYFIQQKLPRYQIGVSVTSNIAEFFGIPVEQARRLFLPSGYIGDQGHMPTPDDVIARLQVLLIEQRANEPPAADEEWGGLTRALEDA
jgi:hypothetical protein